jgi:hypothetical protein
LVSLPPGIDVVADIEHVRPGPDKTLGAAGAGPCRCIASSDRSERKLVGLVRGRIIVDRPDKDISRSELGVADDEGPDPLVLESRHVDFI